MIGYGLKVVFQSGSPMNGFAHAVISTTTAQIGDVVVDVFVTWIRDFVQQVGYSHHKTWLAIPALWYNFIDPGLLHWMQTALWRKSFNGGDVFALSILSGIRARPYGIPVDV
jgi:hypothetical protein